MESYAALNDEEAKEKIKEAERYLREELEREITKRLDQEGLEWFESYQAKCRALESAKELLFFTDGWTKRGKLGN